MTKASDNVFPRLLISEGGSTTTPAAGNVTVYAKANGLLYSKDDAGAETALGGGSGVADQGTFTYFDATEAAAPATPAAGKVRIYAKADGLMYSKDDAGAESAMSGGGGGLTHSYVGYNTVGASQENMGAGKIYTKKFTLAAAGVLTAISAYIQQDSDNVHGVVFGLYDDAAGVPDHNIFGGSMADGNFNLLLGDASGGPWDARWWHGSVGVYLAAGDYHLAVAKSDAQAGNLKISYDITGSDRTFTPGANGWWPDGGRYAQTDSTLKYSIRGSVIT